MAITINGSGTITGVNAGGLPDGSVTADDLATDSVTTAKIEDSAVTTAKITDANITAAKLDGGQSGSAPIYGCRAWVYFDGTRNEADTGSSTNGANVKIFGSGNVTSVLKNATGDYTLTFTTALPTANYAHVEASGVGNHTTNTRALTEIGKNTTNFQVKCENSAGTDTDDRVNIAIFC